MNATFLAWNYMMGNRDAARMVFHYLTTTAWVAEAKADVLLCNTFADLEPDIFTTQQRPPAAASILPIGPLRTWRRPSASEAPAGHFWPADDEACLSFLDAQPRGSVVYVAFGSLAVMSPAQLQELAHALSASGRPFLWVLRPGLAGKLPTAFTDLVEQHDGGGRGKLVEWAPQESVLAHSAVGCFVTHCGWNSTLEGIRNGVPLLCWPYFTDQFPNQTYICDIWRVGIRMATVGRDSIIVTKEEIMERLESLLGDDDVKERVNRLKELAESSMSEEGQSLKNLNAFMESMRK
jgi:UDP:flavonoid glycosyltransferase YjiC (YdhE family)